MYVTGKKKKILNSPFPNLFTLWEFVVIWNFKAPILHSSLWDLSLWLQLISESVLDFYNQDGLMWKSKLTDTFALAAD